MKVISSVQQGMRSASERLGQPLKRLHVLGSRLVWTKRRHVKLASLQMPEMYWAVRHERPQVIGRPHCETVVVRQLGARSTDPGAMVPRADESFADWLVERRLRFLDVANEPYVRTVRMRPANGEFARVSRDGLRL
ncbi:MAG TPA: hypothetical protein VNO35_16805 [Steroidobacteraceae bacterium]|nr:hypothetical protein [Steroidobacteraceae bacterium]